jgi:hypothetical protein
VLRSPAVRLGKGDGILAVLGTSIGVAFLLFQVGAIATQHLGTTRYFAWAPNDYVVQYELRVRTDGRALTTGEIMARYRRLYGTSAGDPTAMSVSGIYENPPQQLIDSIQQYETTYGRNDHAEVTLTYRIDTHAPVVWKWHG